jgi:deoxycytidylate deaminase
MLELPYLPPNRRILYVSLENQFMQAAKDTAENFSLDPSHPTGAVIVYNNQIIGRGANGSTWHEKNGCARKQKNIPTGQGYDLCEGCHPKNHAEQKAIIDASEKFSANIDKSDIYLWGHWWCCQSCWQKMIESGINNIYLVESADKLFKK